MRSTFNLVMTCRSTNKPYKIISNRTNDHTFENCGERRTTIHSRCRWMTCMSTVVQRITMNGLKLGDCWDFIKILIMHMLITTRTKQLMLNLANDTLYGQRISTKDIKATAPTNTCITVVYLAHRTRRHVTLWIEIIDVSKWTVTRLLLT
jgi:hypothetical protein